MREVEDEFRKRSDVKGRDNCFVLPLLLYGDGISPGWNSAFHIMNTQVNLGYFPPDLMNKNEAKILPGVPGLFGDDTSDGLLLTHLAKQFDGGKTKAAEELKEFKREVHFRWWRVVRDQINYGWRYGYQVIVLGVGVCTLYPVLACLIGDDPHLSFMAGMKEGQCLYGCRSCMFPIQTMNVYDKDLYKERDFVRLMALLDEAAPIKAKQRLSTRATKKDSKLTRPENALLNQVERENSLHVSPRSPFHHVHWGSKNYSVFNGGTPPDDMHMIYAGIMSTVKSIVTRIVIAFDESSDPRFKGKSLALLEKRIKAMDKRHTDMDSVAWMIFHRGLARLVKDTMKGKKEQATGTLGGERCSSSLVMCMQLLLAIGTEGDIIPNTNTYTFTLPPPSARQQKRNNPFTATDSAET